MIIVISLCAFVCLADHFSVHLCFSHYDLLCDTGLVDGYAAEKAALEETLSLKETSEHQLVLELEKSQEKLKVLTQEPSALREEKELLLRLQEVLSSSEKDVKIGETLYCNIVVVHN